MLSQSRGAVPSYYLQDGQGSTRALTDASGAITDSYSYTAFGETYSQSGATPNTYLFTGQQYDAGTGLYSLRARYYNPGLGRFLSRDSAEVLYGNPVELNRYAYAANNPVNYYDPSGYTTNEYAPTLTFLGITVAKKTAYRAFRFFTAATLLLVAAILGDLVLDLPRDLTQPGTIEKEAEDVLPPNIAAQVERAWENFKKSQQLKDPIVLPTPRPIPTIIPPIYPTPDLDDDDCDSTTFTAWWFTLGEVQGDHNAVWYAYEQRVARGNGIYGDNPRRVPTGPVNADGIEPHTCRLVDAKYAEDPNNPQYRKDGPPWQSPDNEKLVDEMRRYLRAITVSNGFPGAQPRGLIIRTNSLLSIPFFEEVLIGVNFTLGVNGFVRYVP